MENNNPLVYGEALVYGNARVNGEARISSRTHLVVLTGLWKWPLSFFRTQTGYQLNYGPVCLKDLSRMEQTARELNFRVPDGWENVRDFLLLRAVGWAPVDLSG